MRKNIKKNDKTHTNQTKKYIRQVSSSKAIMMLSFVSQIFPVGSDDDESHSDSSPFLMEVRKGKYSVIRF